MSKLRLLEREKEKRPAPRCKPYLDEIVYRPDSISKDPVGKSYYNYLSYFFCFLP